MPKSFLINDLGASTRGMLPKRLF